MHREIVLWNGLSGDAFGLASTAMNERSEVFGRWATLQGIIYRVGYEEMVKELCLMSCYIGNTSVLINDLCQFVGDGNVSTVFLNSVIR